MSNPTDALGRARAAIQDFWEHDEDDYDAQEGHGVFSAGERRVWTDALGALRPGCTVLDVGTGTGFLALLLDELGHRVTGMDASPTMLARARAKAAENGAGIAFEVGVTEQLPFAGGTFDVVTARHVVWTLPRCRSVTSPTPHR